MEPTILLIGKRQDSLEILKDELLKFDRKILLANSKDSIASQLKNEQVDMVVIGAGLPSEDIESMAKLVKELNSELSLHIMERKPGMNPTHMIGYTNEKAVMWKLMGKGKK